MSNYPTDIEAAELGENGLSKNAGWITVYRVHPDTREYLNANDEYLMVDVGLPAHSYPDKPVLPPAGQALRRSLDGLYWEHVPDYRGKTVYNTGTREASTVEAMGELAEEVTLLAPATEFDIWNGNKWVTDKAAQHTAEAQAVQQAAKREFASRLTVANARIQPLQDAVDLDMTTEAERAQFIAWKKYRVLLNRVDISTAPDIAWPTPPEG
ncbi:tail fiber assembly protein, partial [Symbiopectobacterium sp.]|uniref:tail fiber assembly protein n=1 Tax=Symbiopectobacterium sp. TaxID=2952789 RepID=UPI003F2BA059